MDIKLKTTGRSYSFLIKAVGLAQYLVEVDGLTMAIEYHLKMHGAVFKAGNYYHNIQSVPRGSDLQIEVDEIPYLAELEAGGYC